ncbi:hypothetical protein MCEMIEM12_00357 [Burkholderiaceae bacterium]|jgi:hypothetical protein
MLPCQMAKEALPDTCFDSIIHSEWQNVKLHLDFQNNDRKFTQTNVTHTA